MKTSYPNAIIRSDDSDTMNQCYSESFYLVDVDCGEITQTGTGIEMLSYILVVSPGTVAWPSGLLGLLDPWHLFVRTETDCSGGVSLSSSSPMFGLGTSSLLNEGFFSVKAAPCHLLDVSFVTYLWCSKLLGLSKPMIGSNCFSKLYLTWFLKPNTFI